MKTGKLLKFQRPGAEVQAYVYREGALVRANVYVSPQQGGQPAAQAAHTVSGANEQGVEADVRAWVDAHYPKDR
jgi:hypothetical protein